MIYKDEALNPQVAFNPAKNIFYHFIVLFSRHNVKVYTCRCLDYRLDFSGFSRAARNPVKTLRTL